jgi:hypothetical protein
MQKFFQTISVKLLLSARLLLNVLPGRPAFYNFDDIVNLFMREWPAFRDLVPFGQTAPAAGTGCMLGDKYRMISHRRLPPIVGGIGIGQPRNNEIPRVLEDCIQPFIPQILGFFARKLKPA